MIFEHALDPVPGPVVGVGGEAQRVADHLVLVHQLDPVVHVIFLRKKPSKVKFKLNKTNMHTFSFNNVL